VAYWPVGDEATRNDYLALAEAALGGVDVRLLVAREAARRRLDTATLRQR
jgi:hypothetical protein